MMIKRIEPDFVHTDERGEICQILSVPVSQVNYLFTKKGAKRGRHYHKENREIFYVISGAVTLSAESVTNETVREEYTFRTGDLFQIEPYTMHDLVFIEDTQMIAFYDIGVQQGEKKDIYTKEDN